MTLKTRAPNNPKPPPTFTVRELRERFGGFTSKQRRRSVFTLLFKPPGRQAFTLPKLRGRSRGFTLLELLVVIGLIAILLVLVTPAFTTIKGAGDVTTAAYMIKDVLEQARTYAMANSTYVWVGFFEEDPTVSAPTNPRQAGVGRVIICVAASTQGNRYKDSLVDASNPHAFYAPPGPSPIAGNDYNPVILAQLGKLIKIDSAHLATLGSVPTRPSVSVEYQVGAPDFGSHPPSAPGTPVANPTTFNYPLSAVSPNIQYTFTNIVEFNPRGAATKIVDVPTSLLEVGVQPAHGHSADTSNNSNVAIQISSTAGGTKIYRR